MNRSDPIDIAICSATMVANIIVVVLLGSIAAAGIAAAWLVYCASVALHSLSCAIKGAGMLPLEMYAKLIGVEIGGGWR